MIDSVFSFSSFSYFSSFRCLLASIPVNYENNAQCVLFVHNIICILSFVFAFSFTV